MAAQPLLLLLLAGLAHARCSFHRCTNTRGGNKGTVDDTGAHTCNAYAGAADTWFHKCTCTEGTAFLTGVSKSTGTGQHGDSTGFSSGYTCCDEDEVPTDAPLCNVHHPQACRANGLYDDDCCARKEISSCAEGFTKVQSDNSCDGKGIVFRYTCVPEANLVDDYSAICKNMTRGGGDRGADCRPDLDKELARNRRDVSIVAGIVCGIALCCFCYYKWRKRVDAKEARHESADPGVPMTAQPAQPSAAPPQAAPQQMQMQMLQVQIPLNWVPGQPVLTAMPGGGQMQVMPPTGSVAGQMIMVQAPVAQPVVAQPVVAQSVVTEPVGMRRNLRAI